MRIGVIVPAYKAEKFIEATLTSIGKQSYRNLECIVVDDGSPDASARISRQFAELDERFRVVSQENGGAAAARNRGLRELSSAVSYVTCMDADDIYLPDALAKLKAVLDSDSKAVAVHGLAEFIDEQGVLTNVGEFAALGRKRIVPKGSRWKSLPDSAPTCFASMVSSSTVFPPGLLLVRRNICDRLGGYDVAMTGAEDWDWNIRLCRHGHIQFLDEVILHYRRHSANQGAGSHVPEMCRRVQYKAYFSPENLPEHREVVRASWRASQAFLARTRVREAVACLREGRPFRAIMRLARVPFIGVRYFRGYPASRWL